MIGIIDYGAGNLFSVQNALEFLGEEFFVSGNAKDLHTADALILPGVGAFPDAMRMLRESHLDDFICSETETKPLLGICLGMQMLFDSSEEFEHTEGLGLIPGTVRRMTPEGLKVPHMGWNNLEIHKPDCPLLADTNEGDSVYFVHSYMAFTEPEYLAATCEYGGTVTALVQRGNVFGAQFHPEKSGTVGLQMLRRFGGLAK